jgi:hypothetical protein
MNPQPRTTDAPPLLPPYLHSECLPEDLDDPPVAGAGSSGTPWVVVLQAVLPLVVGAVGVVMPLV